MANSKINCKTNTELEKTILKEKAVIVIQSV